jgi:short subunit dehydrogenase-like uncharacterized protein
MAERSFDVVLFGATGFTGGLTAEYLARHVPAGARWALAGRNRGKLAGVRERLAETDASLADLTLLEADVDRPESVHAIAADARVVITTVGPYVHYGEPLVAACAETGTDYVDLTGEPEFINTTYVRHHARAVASGSRLVHACGFDSVPHDLGAYFTVQQLPADVPLRVSGYVRANAAFSGGTYSSAITAFSRGRQNLASAHARKAAEPRGGSRRTRYVPGRPHRTPVDPGWALPMPTIDGPLVVRSARALDRYGPDFAYSHFIAVPKAWQAAGLVAGVGGLLVAAQIPPARRALLNRVPAGEGPSEQKRADSWFTVTFVGSAASGGGRRVVTRVSGGDPGYDETAKMLAESALSLAFDDLPATSGQVTTAAAMGDALLGRLQRAGIRFEVLSA